MKRIAATLLGICITVIAFAQLKPEEGDYGLGMRITGLSNIGLFNFDQTNIAGERLQDPLHVLPATTVNSLLPQELLFFRVYMTDTDVLRLGLSGAWTNSKMTSISGTAPDLNTSTYSMNAFSAGILIGLEKHFASAAQRIDPYGGAEVGFSYLGGIKVEDMNSITIGDFSSSQNTVTNYPSGWAANLDFLCGFNFFVSNNFALGAEVSIGYFIINMGGDYSQVEDSELHESGSVTTEHTETVGTAEFKQMGVRTGSTAGVHASIFW